MIQDICTLWEILALSKKLFFSSQRNSWSRIEAFDSRFAYGQNVWLYWPSTAGTNLSVPKDETQNASRASEKCNLQWWPIFSLIDKVQDLEIWETNIDAEHIRASFNVTKESWRLKLNTVFKILKRIQGMADIALVKEGGTLVYLQTWNGPG
jgi:hypothetical protein